MRAKESQKKNEILRIVKLIRAQNVVLDSDLARLLGISTSKLNEKTSNNLGWIGEEEKFKLSEEEVNFLMSSNETSKNYHLKNRNGHPSAYSLEGAMKAAMLIKSNTALSFIKAIANILQGDYTPFDYQEASREEFQSHCREIQIKLANKHTPSEIDVINEDRIITEEYRKFSLAKTLKNSAENLPGWAILKNVSNLLYLKLPCPNWLQTEFKKKINAVLIGKCSDFGETESFGKGVTGKRDRIRSQSGIGQNILTLTELLLSADKHIAKKTGQKRRLKKEETDQNNQTTRESVFRVLGNQETLIKMLLELNVMDNDEIEKHINILKDIAELDAPTINRLYKAEIKKNKSW